MSLTRALSVTVLMAVFGSTGTTAAQIAGAGTGSIVGLVMDATGARVPGAVITVSGAALAPQRTTTSAGDGSYRLVQLLPGDYLLIFAVPGFVLQRREVHVGLASTLTIDVTLSLAPSDEHVIVTGALDRQSTTVAQSFDARQLESLPSSRSLAGLFALTHGLAMPTIEVGGGTGIVTGTMGAFGRNNQPRHTIEGIVVTGLFGAGFSPDYGAIEEVSVLTASQGAEWATSGIHTDIVTKSGSNNYRGTVYGAGEDRRVQSANVDADQVRRGALGGGGLSPAQANQVWRYSDANADAGGFVRRDALWWYASSRRQETAARLVNFQVRPYVTTLANYSAKITARPVPRHTLVFYGQGGLNHQPDRLDPFGPAGSALSTATVINTTAESTVDQRNVSWLWKGEWKAILSDALLVEVRAGQWATDITWAPRSAGSRFEDILTFEVAGGNRAFVSTQRRNQVAGSATYFAENRTGRHNVRFGGDAIRFLVQETWLSGYPGNVLHVLRQSRPSSVYLFDTGSRAEAGVWTWSAFVSDAWQPTRRVTFTSGLRLDGSHLFLPAQSPPASRPEARPFAEVPKVIGWTVVTPRFAAAFDVTGDGRTLAKLSVGRYRGTPNAALAFNANPNGSPWWREYAWTDVNQNGRWEPGEEGAVPLRSRGGVELESIDPDVALSLIDEAGAWVEQMVPGGATIRTGVIWRLERDQSARQNLNQRYEDFTVPVLIPDRGPDGVAGTGDEGPSVTAYDLDPRFVGLDPDNEVRNVPGSSSRYITWEVSATRQTRGRWSAGAGFAHTWNRDHASSHAGQAVRNNVYPVTPNDGINTGHGGRHEFTTWTAKAYGTFHGPWNLRLSPVVRHQSGQPFGRTQTTDRGQLQYGTVTILMEPVGQRRMDHLSLVDLRLDRNTPVRFGRVTTFIDVFNLFNANPEQNAIWSSGTAFLRPVTIVPPRIARVGVAIDW